jgi:DNA-binding NtrC family response regulator
VSETVLVVDDDSAFRQLVVDILQPEGYRLLTAGSAEEALRLVAAEPVDLVLSDQRMPGLDGLQLTRRLRAASDPPEVVVMTAYGTIPRAVEAVRAGAADYLTKPLESPVALRRMVRSLLGRRERADSGDGEFLTRDPAVLELLALADRTAATGATVLITGESGTGKELLAQRIHERSPRADGPFVVVNAAALPETLAESELFGHEKGSFTGADSRHVGRFEAADGGTLFLDEVGELSEALQAKLLRALEQRTIDRVGGGRPIPVDIRLVAATNRDLAREVAARRFREDLYYRLNVVALHLPPLRERPGDLELLVPRLIERLAAGLGLQALPVAPEAMEALRRHPWPGNVRELRNALERALIAATGERIEASDLPPLTALAPPEGRPPGESDEPAGRTDDEPPTLSLAERERRAILDALERTGGHRERAADLLGISVRTLYNRLKEYGIR